MKLRVSIRFKMLFVIAAVLLLAMGTYLYLATTLFTRDKLAYIYDLNSSMVETLSEQTRADLTVLVRELNLLLRDVSLTEEGAEESASLAFFALEPDVIHVEVYQADAGGAYERVHDFAAAGRLEELGLREADLEHMRKERPLPLAALSAQTGSVHIQNSSLPPDAALLTLAVSIPSDQGTLIAACDFRHERLLRIFGRSKLHQTFLVDSRGGVLAHPDAQQVLARAGLAERPLVRAALDSKVERGVHELEDAGGEVLLGAFARVGLGGLTVITQLPKRVALQASAELIRRSLLFGVAILLAAFVASVFFSRLLTAPIRKLRAAAKLLGQGRFDVDPGVRSGDEIGELADSFREMARAIKQTQAQLVRSEKLAAFGQLGAGITHEVKNPMTGIIGFAQVAQLKMDKPEKIQELLKMIETEAKRCKDILVNFLKFASQDSKQLQQIDVNGVVREAAKIVNHQLMINKVKLEVELAEGLEPIMGNAGELQQVLLNLAMNAQQAMPGGGHVWFRTRREGEGAAVIEVQDDGPGMPLSVQQRVFEPFFTTKAAGEGTGLGLSISYGIISDHDGKIEIDSTEGEGTLFSLHIPFAALGAPPPLPTAQDTTDRGRESRDHG